MEKQKRAFAKLQKSYGLTDPAQIKERIILNNVLAIAQAVHGDDENNRRLMRIYESQFKLCEMQENMNK